MSTSREVTVWCDDEGCGEWTYGNGDNHTNAEARLGARRLGWECSSRGDFCIEHARPNLPPPPPLELPDGARLVRLDEIPISHDRTCPPTAPHRQQRTDVT